jgi:phospholipid/cholesterol/gamma-HCH transport system substrate-binding protein
MVIIALAIVTRALLFLHPSPGDGKTKILVLFQSVDKIAPGTRVTFAGKPVGEVKRVDPVPNTTDQRQLLKCPIFPYEVLIAIDSSITVYQTDEISVKTSGLMGERFIAITPRPTREGIELKPVTPTDVVFASQSGSVEETFSEISGVARKADETMEALIRLIERNQEGIFQTTKAVEEASTQLGILLKTLNQEHFGEQLSVLGSTAIVTLEKVNRLASEVEEKQVVSKLTSVTEHLQNISSKLDNPEKLEQFVTHLPDLEKTAISLQNAADSLQVAISSAQPALTALGNGNGTLGKLIRDPKLYERLDLLASDVGNYGLLFHLNRDWQRERYVRQEIASSEMSADEALENLQKALTSAQQTLEKGLLSDAKQKEQFCSGLKQAQNEIDRLQKAVQELDIGERTEETR